MNIEEFLKIRSSRGRVFVRWGNEIEIDEIGVSHLELLKKLKKDDLLTRRYYKEYLMSGRPVETLDFGMIVRVDDTVFLDGWSRQLDLPTEKQQQKMRDYTLKILEEDHSELNFCRLDII